VKGFTLRVTKRDVLGKKTKFLRRQGITPTHLFGHGMKSLSLQCDTTELQRLIARAGTTRRIALEFEEDKKPRSVFIREIQREARTRALLHVDFYQVREKEEIKADVPIVLVGEAPALREKGCSLTRGVTSLSIDCLPDKLPPQIEVELSLLEKAGQAIYVKDIVLNSDIAVNTDPGQLVVKVSEARVERVEEVVREEVAEEVEAAAPTEE